MEGTATDMSTLDLVGGRLCLDFANTVNSYHDERSYDYLTSYHDLVAWGVHTGILDDTSAQRLLRAAERRSGDAQAVFEDAMMLRRAIFRLFSDHAAGLPANPDDLDVLNHAHVRALAHLQVVPSEDGFAWQWHGGPEDLEQMLWPVVHSAAELLTSEELHRVTECGGQGCDWLFLDTSKNHSRRWCDMKGCGNRAKARRHYHRAKQESA